MAWVSSGWKTTDLNLLGNTVTFIRDQSNSPVVKTVDSHQKTFNVKTVAPVEKADWKTSTVFAETSLKLTVSWKEAGKVRLDRSNKLAFPKSPKKPGLYRFRISNSHYIGETVNIRRRFQNYRNPGPKQPTNLRINKAIHKTLSEGKAVFVDVISDEVIISNQGVEASFDLSSKSTRRFIENGIIFREESEEIENLNL